jgi:hypothetical protein
MTRLPGQAARGMLRLLQWVASIALALVTLAIVAIALLGWRLTQGPLDIPWLTQRIEAAVNAGDSTTHLSIGMVALAWEGVSRGLDAPLDLRLRAVDMTDRTGARLISIPRAGVSLSLPGLLFGRVEPRSVEIDDANVTVFRSAAGAISLDLQSVPESTTADTTGPASEGPGLDLASLLGELGKPTADVLGTQQGWLSQLRRVRIENASVVVVDHQLQATWKAPHAEIDLTRRAAGGVEGHANLTVALGDQTTKLTAEASLAQGGKSTQVRAAFTPVAPAALAHAAPKLAPLAALDAPVGATMTLDLGPTLAVQQARMTVQVGAGTLHAGASAITVVDGVVVTVGNAESMSLESARLSVRAHDGGDVSVLSATGRLRRDPDRLRARLALQIDAVGFADLPGLWPEGVGGVTRDWITQNITAGTARNGKLELQIDAASDFSDVAVTGAHGTLDGDGLTVYWLRPIPPIDQGVAQLRILDPDRLEIAIASGRQRPVGGKGDAGGLAVTDSTLKITGMQGRTQSIAIDATLSGALADAVAVLQTPPLNLLPAQPIDFASASGKVSAKLTIAMPLTDPVSKDAITVEAQAHLEGVHVSGLVAGRDMDQGAIDLKASRDGMTLTGRALLDAIPANFDASLDFRDGPASDVTQTVNITGQPTAGQLTAAGLNPGGVFASGTAGLQVQMKQRRDGQAVVDVAADFAAADMRLAAADWSKPAGTAARADAVLRLDHGRLVGIDQIAFDGPRAQVQGHAIVGDGVTSALQIDQFTMGRTTARGSIRFPGPKGGPIVATVTGAELDLAGRLSYHGGEGGRSEGDHASADTFGQAWRLDARFERALMANAQTFNGLVLHAEGDGHLLSRLRFDARAGPGAPIALEIATVSGVRRLTASAGDAGRLMKALDIMQTLEGGRLTITGTFDDRTAGRQLSGTAEIQDFRMRNQPAMARVLQAMTLYGLVNAIGGQGLGFDKLIAPFRLSRSVLELDQARAFNSSIGLTAHGRIDLATDVAEIDGTVVPAYFFNSLLGKIPLLGKLFSPQAGGGLFSANYTVRGALSDPKVSVNPLSALTPGALRSLFGNF